MKPEKHEAKGDTHNEYHADQMINVTGPNPTFEQINMGKPHAKHSKTPSLSKLRTHLFLSYRRSASQSFALMLQEKLQARINGEVFLDVHGLGVGELAPELERQIAACDYFLLIVSRGTFDRIHEPEDWIHQEISHALRFRRPIVLVLQDDADYPLAQDLPTDIQALTNYNGVRIHLDVIEASVDNLIAKIVKRS